MSVENRNFKISKESSFYSRNKSIAKSRMIENNSDRCFIDCDYEILKSSVTLTVGGILLTLKRVSDTESCLSGEILMFTDGSLHVFFDEINPIYPRFRVDLETSLTRVQSCTIRSEENEVIWDYRDFKHVITLSPFKLQSFFKEDLVLSANSQSLMNFEKYQRQEVTQPILHENNTQKTFDATNPILEDSQDIDLSSKDHSKFHEIIPRGPSSVAIDFEFINSADLMGIPSHADSVHLKDTTDSEPYRLFNVDSYEFPLGSKNSLYGSVPFMVSINYQENSAGVFWINTSETWIDIETLKYSKTTHWMSEAGVLEFIVLIDESPLKVIEKFTLLTGSPQLPPISALGYHQSRYSYMTQADVLEVSQGFIDHRIPLDVIWLDIDHTEDKKYFTWDYSNFPDPLLMQNTLKEQGKYLVTVSDPHLKVDENFSVHLEADSKDFYVKSLEQIPFVGKCWPGDSSWPDFINPEVRKYWSDNYSLEKYKDSGDNLFIWNDMNEPAVFDSPENTMPKSNLHGIYEHREVHNVYGKLMHQSTFEGLINRNSGNRPFVLSRSFWAGTQRYGAVWTGDTKSDWENLDYSVPMNLSIAIGGISFCGSDVGGFTGDPSEDLLVRWYQLGIYNPFFRGHSAINCKRREPWLYSEEVMSKIKFSISERYAMISYWYTLFYLYSKYGTPVIRAMSIEFPNDLCARDLNKQFMVGDSILVCSVYEENQEYVKVYLPDNRWFDYHTFIELNSGFIKYETSSNWIPTFIRGGTILPNRNIHRNCTKEMLGDPFALIVALDTNYEAYGSLYMDDTITHRYREGEFLFARIKLTDSTLTYKLENHLQITNQISSIKICGFKTTPNSVLLHCNDLTKLLDFEADCNSLTISNIPVLISEEWAIVFN